MFPEKPKRKVRKFISSPFVVMLMIPALFVWGFRSELELGLLGDSIALTVMLSAAIYLAYQFIEWLIRGYK